MFLPSLWPAIIDRLLHIHVDIGITSTYIKQGIHDTKGFIIHESSVIHRFVCFLLAYHRLLHKSLCSGLETRQGRH